MEWWNDVVAWFNSAAGWRVFSTAILPFLAIIVAGLLAAWIASGFSRRVLDHQNREIKAAAIMALIGAGRRAVIWSSLGGDEKQHIDSLISEADLRVRLLPVSGAIAAADWAAHELSAMKKNSASFSFQAEQTFIDYRDRLLDWQLKPSRAKKLFAFDLVQWRYEDGDANQSSLVAQQQEWATAHVEPTGSIPVVAPTPTMGTGVASPAAAPATAATTPVVAQPTTPPPLTPAAFSSAPAPSAATSASGPTPVSAAAPASPQSPVSTQSPTPVQSPASEDEPVDEDEAVNPVAPPVTAGTVRQRTAPERSIDGD